ncbi:MAG TPA: dTMP kinase [Candidatus Paceibacterota bacterium]
MSTVHQQSPQKGLYVAIEGIDGCGKSTVAPVAAEELKAYLTREPGDSPLAAAVREVLLRDEGVTDPMAEFSLFWGARFALVSSRIVPQLDAGRHVVSDRADASTYAYQLCGRQLGEMVPSAYEAFWAMRRCLPKRPDLYVYLDLPPELAAERRAKANRQHETNHFDRESQAFFQCLRAGYEKFFANVPEKLVRIDATAPIPEVAAAIVAAVREHQPALI